MRRSDAGLEASAAATCRDVSLVAPQPVLRWHVLNSRGTAPGLPDDFILAGSTLFVCEFKKTGGRRTPAQVYAMERFQQVDRIVADFCEPADWPAWQDLILAAARGEPMTLVCFLAGLVWSLRVGAVISGHAYVEVSTVGTVQVLRCSRCGVESVGWFPRIP